MTAERQLIGRAPGDDVIVRVRLRRSSFQALTSDPDGRSVAVGDGRVGLVPETDQTGTLRPIYALVVWSPEPVWRGVPEQIPGNELSAAALRDEEARR